MKGKLIDLINDDTIEEYDRIVVAQASPNLGIDYDYIEIDIHKIIDTDEGRLIKYKVCSGPNENTIFWRNINELSEQYVVYKFIKPAKYFNAPICS